jgi:hypothetical protein
MKYLKLYENFTDSLSSDDGTEMINTTSLQSQEEEDHTEEDYTADDVISRWEARFGDNEPTTQEKYDFYADLRNEGFDGFLIFDTLGDKMNTEDESQDDYEDEEGF